MEKNLNYVEKDSNSMNSSMDSSLNLVDALSNFGKRSHAFRVSEDPTDFSAFEVSDDFEDETIDCSNMTAVCCVEEHVKYKLVACDCTVKVTKQYNSLANYLREVEELNHITLMPSVIGVSFMRQFEKFLQTKGLSSNTIASLINRLKTAMRWAGCHGAKIPVDFEWFKVKTYETKPKLVLTQDEIYRMYFFNIDGLPVSTRLKKIYTKVRDHFVMSWFMGLQYSDAIRISKTNFHTASMDFFITDLNSGSQAIIDLHKFYGETPSALKEILIKYDYKSPWTGDRSDYNKYLKKLCEYIGFNDVVTFRCNKGGQWQVAKYNKYELVCSSVATRSFIANAIKNKVDDYTIKRAIGRVSDLSRGEYMSRTYSDSKGSVTEGSFGKYVIVENDHRD